MKASSLIALAVFGTCFLNAKRVEAKPFLYTDSYPHGGNAQGCLAKAKSALKKLSFDNFDVDDSSKHIRSLSVKGYHQEEYIIAEIECNQKLGITTLGVSGLDNDMTYEMYLKLHEAEW